MTLRDDRLDEFVELWERVFGERINRDDARTRAHHLVELYRAIAEDARYDAGESAPPPTTGGSSSDGATGAGD
jgi:hypothetical protein